MPALNAKAEADRIIKRLSRKEREAAMELLERDGYQITKLAPKERAVVDLGVRVKPGGKVRIAFVSDTHIGSKFQQVTRLNQFYARADEWGAQAFLHGGDVLEGYHVHRDSVYEQYAHGFKAQAAAFVDQYPRSKNAPTQFIDGNHDAWYFEQAGLESGEELAKKRDDLRFLGFHSAFVNVGGLRVLVQHGAPGGNAYALSYKIQKLLEALDVEERSLTHVAAYGHWHRELYLGRYQGVFGFRLGCFKSQDRFHRKFGLAPSVCGLLLTVEFTRDMSVWEIDPKFVTYKPLANDYPGGR